MIRWLLEHEADVQAYVWLAAFFVVALCETLLPRRALVVPAGARWVQQLTLVTLASAVLWLCTPIAVIALAVLVEQRGIGLLNAIAAPAWLSIVIGVVALDLANYVQHRLEHAVPLLWRFHQVHHSDLDVDSGTSLRHHPGEALVSQVTVLTTITVVGVPPLAVLTGLSLAAVASVFNHGNLALPPRVDAVLRRLVVTPDMHRIHHSARLDESNANFANLLPWWDRLFATYRCASSVDQSRMTLGLGKAQVPSDITLGKLLRMPFQPMRQTRAVTRVDGADIPPSPSWGS